MGGAFLSASLQVLFDRLASREVVNFVRGQRFTPELLKKMEITLLTVYTVLNDAEVKQIANPQVTKWVEELKHVVYEAEDLLDEIATEALRCKMESDSQTSATQVWSIISTSLDSFGEGIESRVEGIIDRLEFLAQQKDVLGLKEGEGEKRSQRWPSASLVDESGVYGRGGSKEEIIEFLLCDNQRGNEACVISIVGMGGHGKTTLSQLVYNDERVDTHFDLKSWVCVSDEFDLLKIMKAILRQVSPLNSKVKDPNLLQVRLKESLNGKKFLLVLDDVWNENYNNWDLLHTPLKAGFKGSKIIVTTRSEKVALIMRATRIHHLGQLPFEDCWSIFAKHAFGSGDSSLHPKLEAIGKEIVGKCNGSPLAAKILGGILYCKVAEEEWENILNSEMWKLPTNEIFSSLRLSYYYLPSHLKRCFAYCSIFPKNYEFQKEKLILLWMAEGFLQEPSSKKREEGVSKLEEVGDKYFNELLSRSFFQKSSNNRSCFVMHDLMNDLAQLVSGEFGIRLENDERHETLEKVRHLSYFRTECDAFGRFEAFNDINCLRTFLSLQIQASGSVSHLSKRVSHDLLPTLRWLRVLSLCDYKIIDLPDSIGNLKHLRYLDLSNCIFLIRLPKSIGTLYNLQTMILSGCFSLIELPVGMGKLINLRHLDITDTKVTKMPADIGQLKSLQTLSTFMVGHGDRSSIGKLRELPYISGKLQIAGLQHVLGFRDALEANLKDKRYLDELLLQWNHSTDGVLQHGTDILNKLQPHTNLKRLSINCFGGTRFPVWLGDLSFFNIVTLHLYKCKHCSFLPPLGQLPSLQVLDIRGMNGVERVGSEFYGNDYLPAKPFTSLETLRFEDLPEWKEWLSFRGEGGEFPRLQEFYIQNCPKLTGDLPVQLPSLIKLEIKGCNQLLVSLPRFPAIRKLKMLKCGNGLSQITYSGFTSLESLVVSDISQLKELPPGLRWLSINNCESVESPLERMLQSNTHLQYLEIKHCSFSRFLQRGGLPTTLKSVSIYNSKKLEFLLQEFLKCHHPFLERLSIHVGTCNSLSSFSFGFFPRLTHVEISYLEGLESLLITIPEADLTSLQWMFIRGCPNLVSIGLPALDSSCPLLASSQQSVGHALSSLQTLTLHDCPELLFPREGFPSNLRSLEIHNCNKLSLQEDWGLQRYSSLTHFRISGGCEGLETFPKDCLLPSNLTSLQISRLPDLKSLDNNGLKHLALLENLWVDWCPKLQLLAEQGFEHLTSLKELRISDCASLQSLTQVGLQHLNCLRRLCISGCHKLQCLTEERLPASLSFLEIRYCPLLKRRCKFREGQDWHYISHIPCIVIDDQAF